MNKPIKYIAFYSDNVHDGQNRIATLSATNKIDYICTAITRNNYEVEIVSPSWTKNSSGFYKGDVKRITDSITLKTFATFGGESKIKRIFKYLFSLIQLFFYLLISTEKDEPIIVYHSVILSLPIRTAKLFKKFKIILEVEEIYQDAQNLSGFMKKNEYKAFASGDKYLFSTELLNQKINKTNKPQSIIYGTYQVEKDREASFEDDKIHVVYAGTFDPIKGGALAAIDAAKYLTKDYHIHIIGFGSIEQIKSIEDKVAEVSLISDAIVSYHGLLKGEDYIQFIQKCQIGLSTQIPGAKYNETSFPSKILSYMANGLKVVSIRIKAIEYSSIGSQIYYYQQQDPKEIANKIISIDFSSSYDSRKLIKSLDENFLKEIKLLLKTKE
ncbi:glycosyltransferase [Metabacillus litoralis]|nr:glycosyltransferase [Metabacillus litoralis]